MAGSTHPVRSLDDIGTVVDCDAHLREREEDLFEYIEAPFDDLLKVNDAHQPHSKSLYPNAGYLTPTKTGMVQNPQVRTPDDVREAMDQLNTDKVLLTPGLNLRLSYVHHDELAVALANAYNSWLLDRFMDADPDFYGTVLVAPQRPDRAAEEIDRRAGESKMRGVLIAGAGANPPLGSDRYFPIYEAAEDAGLPVIIHSGSTGLMANFPLQWRGTKRYMDAHLLGHPLDHMVHLSTMLTNGVPVRFPDLNFVIQEGGLGWIPFLLERYDNEYSEKSYDAPLLEKTPSEYVRDQFYFTSQPVEGADNREYITNIVRMIGPENLMFASDYPHFDFDYTDALLNSLRSEFTGEELEDIYGRTAIELFGL